ncbi:MAG: YXWGXW repeat-containing protein [Polyangiaceae bacterium]
MLPKSFVSRSHRARTALALAGFAGLAAIAACSSGLPRPPYVGQPTSALGQVPYEPPPARVEAIPDRPSPDTVWIDGEWQWAGRAWSWKRGRWVVPPEKTAYSPWTSVRSGDGMLYFAPGTWRDASGVAIAAPPAISYGKPTRGAIVNSDGVNENTGRNIKETQTAEDKAEKRAKHDNGDAGVTIPFVDAGVASVEEGSP